MALLIEIDCRGQGDDTFGARILFLAAAHKIAPGLQFLKRAGNHGFVDIHFLRQMALADLTMKADMLNEL